MSLWELPFDQFDILTSLSSLTKTPVTAQPQGTMKLTCTLKTVSEKKMKDRSMHQQTTDPFAQRLIRLERLK